MRHALAIPRADWDRGDDRRPLTKRGIRQADGLVELLAGHDFERIVTSPTVRCRRTVAPLGEARGVEVETAKSLREGRAGDALDLLLDAVGDTVLCTHGDVIGEVLRGLRHLGWPVPPRPGKAKGSVWLLRREGPCAYLPPPA